jgi:flavin-binding protein dodecin
MHRMACHRFRIGTFPPSYSVSSSCTWPRGGGDWSLDALIRRKRCRDALYMSWFEVAEVRGQLEDNKVARWQVTVKVGFTLDS